MNWFSFAYGAVPALLFSWLFHTISVDLLKHRQALAIAEQRAVDIKSCESDKSITKESNDALQKDRDAIANRLNSLLMQKPASCVPVSQPPQLSSNKRTKYAGPHGVSSDFLREFAAECEGYRDEIKTCIGFVNNAANKK